MFYVLYIYIYIYIFLNHIIYVVMWKNVVELGGPQMIIQRIRIAF